MPYKPPISEPIAVVGTSCRFAGGVTTPSRLWRLLARPTDLAREVPPERFNIQAFYHPDGEYHGTTNAAKAYFIDQDHRVFDSGFFNISPKEAEAIDPQQRMTLEVVYEALESAGYTLRQYAGEKVGVFAGLMTGDYDTLCQRDELNTSQYYATGNARSILANRISYFFDFRGPSMTIDTACSSSLVALHQAVLSLRSGECKMACVAGANLILTPEQFVAESSLHMLSPTGHCRMWDANADGYARGEGIAAMLVKPLSQALADGDYIHAVIRETGINSDGRSRGITMPNWEAQSRLIQDTYQRAGLDPRDPGDRCQYFEAHGTGTQAGDPNEARAIEDAFFGKSGPCVPASASRLLVGSVKTIIGHTEGAAGLAGLLKVVESMRHNSVPMNLHLDAVSPEVQKYYSHLLVPASLVPWPTVPRSQPKRGSVNSFGFGGTNAHAIVEHYVPELHDPVAAMFRPALEFPFSSRTVINNSRSQDDRICLPLVLSAPSQKSLIAVVKTYRDFLIRNSPKNPEEVAWHAFARRTAFRFRVTVSSVTTSGLVDKLNGLLAPKGYASGVDIGTRARPQNEQPKMLGIFTGQGAQWATMSRGLLRSSRVYAETIRGLDKILQTCPDPPLWSLEQEIMADEDCSNVQKASVSQPLCTAVQLALVDLLRHLGITFHTVVGHSSGEIAAAYAAGRITIRDAILIAHYRGLGVDMARGAQGVAGGMLAASLTKEEALEMCASQKYSNRLWLAAVNGPSTVTLSGNLDAVQQAVEELAVQQKFARRLLVDKAYHSPHMKQASVKYEEKLNVCNITPVCDSPVAWVSSVYGWGAPPATDLVARYWKDNMVKPVLFYDAVSTALKTLGPFDCAIEVGPHAALKGPVVQIMKRMNVSSIPYSGLLDRGLDDREAFANVLGWIWARFSSLSSHIRQFVLSSAQPELASTRVIDAPSYPWDHSQRFYRESRLSRQYHFKTERPHELLGVRTRDDNECQLRWRNILNYETLPWVRHHCFQGHALLPASAYLAMALDATRAALKGRQAAVIELRDLMFCSGITIEPDAPGVEVLFNLTLDREAHARGATVEGSFTLTSTIADGRTDMKKNFSGTFIATLGEPSTTALPARATAQAETVHANCDAFYDMMAGLGLGYTSPFRALKTLRRRYNFATATLNKRHDEDTTALAVSPAMLDSCLQTAYATISSPGDKSIWTSFLPLEMECVRFNMATCGNGNHTTDSLVVDAYLTKATPCTEQGPASFTADIEVFNFQGVMEIQVQGLTVGSFSPAKPENDHELYLTTVIDLDPDDEIVSAHHEMDATSPMLAESCERVAAFYINQGSLRSIPVSPSFATPRLSNIGLFPMPWPRETEESMFKFIRASPYFAALEFMRLLGQSSPEMLARMMPTVIEEAQQLVEFQEHVTRVVRQISHKYPRMNVLGLTDPNLGLAGHILAGLDENFVSYRIGWEPDEDLEHRVPKSTWKKITTEKVDLDADEPSNGTLYDLVLLTTSIIGPPKAATALNMVSHMMRPGGFLILVDASRSPLRNRIRLDAGASSASNAPLSPPDWPDVLEQCGFGFSPRNGHQHYPSGFSLVVCQAECSEKSLLLHPSAWPREYRPDDGVLVVGGTLRETRPISTGVLSAFRRGSVIRASEALDSVDISSLDGFSAAIILHDLDEPILATMTEHRMEVLRALFQPQMTILWVTHGARSHNPDHAASFGFTRTLAAETPGLVLQMLDLDSLKTAPAVKAITDAFVRLMERALVDDMTIENPLWTMEPEVHIKNKRRYIPRVLPWKEGNDRANAPRRVVSKMINTLEHVVQIVPGEAGDGRHEIGVGTFDSLTLGPGTLGLQVDYSAVEAIHIGRAPSYLCVGRGIVTGKAYVALSRTNASYVAVPETSAVCIGTSALAQPAILAYLVRYLVVLRIADAAQGQSVLLIEPDAMFYECAREILGIRGVQLRVCTTDAARYRARPGVVYIHPNAPLRDIKALYPARGGWVIDMLQTPSELSELFVRALPQTCKYTAYTTLLGSVALSHGDNDDVPALWEEAVRSALSRAAALDYDAEVPVVTAPELIRCSTRPAPLQIIDWKAERSVPQRIKPLAGTQLLSPTKTYVLVGLTRDFGQSLSTLFVEQGARHIVLCSRNPPTTQPTWQAEMIRKGIAVQFESLDVTDLEQVVAFKAKLGETLPPVGGVVNGAMVLDDRVFMQMPLETLQRVMQPKTVGSRNLDMVFDSPNMEFFIMTSSFAAVGGHAGQANYAAANMYMNGLAASRRRRGLAGSVLNIGVIYGLGFLHREKDDLYQGLEREGYPPVSERDIHHMFVEAIVAGRPTFDQIYDITTGLRRFSAKNPTLHWHNDPRFSHFTIQEEDEACSHPASGSARQQSLRELIDGATTKDQLVQVLAGALIERLQSQLQLDEGSVTGEHSVAELGADSLAAVELRAWAWRALGQDLAVMKILGGATVLGMCEELAGGILATRAAEARPGAEMEQNRVVVMAASTSSVQSPASTPAELMTPSSTASDVSAVSPGLEKGLGMME